MITVFRLAAGLTLTLGIASVSAQTAPNPLPHLDEQFGCLSPTDADRYIKDFRVDIRSFGGLELCRPNHDARRVLADIYLIENGRFGRAQRNNLIRDYVPADRYYDWARRQTRGMRRGNDIPYASAYNRGGFFTFQDGWAQSSTLGRVGTILHEARHTQGYGHIPCVRGPYAGSSVAGCDSGLAQGGSHGVEMEYYARVVVMGENFHPVYKSMARLMALGRSNAFFNDPAVKAREGLAFRRAGNRGGYGLYASTEASRPNARFLNASRVLDRVAPSIPNARLKRSSFGATLYAGDRAFAIDLYGREQGPAELADAYSYFKMLFRDDTRKIPVVDMEEFDLGERRYLVALTRDNRLMSYDFPQGEWESRPENVGLRDARFTTTDPNGTAGLFLVAPNGQARRWNPQTGRLEAYAVTWPSNVRDFIRFEGKVLALGDNRVIYAVDQGRLVPFDALRGVAAEELVSVPLYDAFNVEN